MRRMLYPERFPSFYRPLPMALMIFLVLSSLPARGVQASNAKHHAKSRPKEIH